MEQDIFSHVVETFKLYQDPNVDNFVKEKAVKTLLKRIVDIQPNYGARTKQDFKRLIDYSQNEKDLSEMIGGYFLTHDVRL